MKLMVCIKQVPGTTKVEIDEETGAMKRDGLKSKMNPFDLYALETALRLKEQYGAQVTVMTMGPRQAEAVIREAYMMGADEGYLLSDRKFAGSDVLATSYTLSCGIRSIGPFDLIGCGRQTTDGDTAQVGPALAEHLGIPHVTWVSKICSLDSHGLVVEQNMENSYERVRLPFPALITVEKDIYTPRLPSYRHIKRRLNGPVIVLSLADLPEQSEKPYGLLGSPTQVERVFQPESDVERIVWDRNKTDCVRELFELLSENKYIQERLYCGKSEH